MKKFITILILFAFAVALNACAGATHQESKARTGVLIGAGAGAATGQAIGRDTRGTLIGAALGAAIGGLAGHQIGGYMDQQEHELRNVVAATDAASIRRTQDVLTATFKSDFLFDFDSATLKPGAYTELNRVANVLVQYPQTRIRVEGHTDMVGGEVYNQQLSERRAEAVKSALVQRGVSPYRINTIGYGKSQPISSVDALNRRVEIVIIPIEQG